VVVAVVGEKERAVILGICRKCWEEMSGRTGYPGDFAFRHEAGPPVLRNGAYPTAWVCPMCRKERQGHVLVDVPEGLLMVAGDL
jgi:rubredoxin